MGMRGINGAPDLPLGGSSFHLLAFSCPTGPHALVRPVDVVPRAEVAAFLKTVLHERHMALHQPLFHAL